MTVNIYPHSETLLKVIVNNSLEPDLGFITHDDAEKLIRQIKNAKKG